MILDPEVGVPLLDGLLSQLVNAYVRPMAAMLFPEDVGRHEDTTGTANCIIIDHFSAFGFEVVALFSRCR